MPNKKATRSFHKGCLFLPLITNDAITTASGEGCESQIFQPYFKTLAFKPNGKVI